MTATTGSTISTDTAGGATTMTGRDSGGKLGWMDKRFVTKAADSGMTEVNLAKLAAEKASNPEVKSFAQKIVDDHTKVGEELKSLASTKNVKLEDDDLGSDRAHKRLSKKSGAEFDQEFIALMVDMHEDDVKLFEKASTSAKDSELRSFASKHVDHLRQHLQQAQSLQQSTVPTGRMDSSSGRSQSSNTDTSSSSTEATSGASRSGSTSGTSGLTGTPGTSPGSSTDAGGTGTTSASGTGASSTDSSSTSGSSSDTSGSTKTRGSR